MVIFIMLWTIITQIVQHRHSIQTAQTRYWALAASLKEIFTMYRASSSSQNTVTFIVKIQDGSIHRPSSSLRVNIILATPASTLISSLPLDPNR